MKGWYLGENKQDYACCAKKRKRENDGYMRFTPGTKRKRLANVFL